MQSNPWSNTQQRWTASGFPFTIAIMVALGLTAFLALISPALYASLRFVAPISLSMPWTLLTYPLLGEPSIWMLFTLGLVYFLCGSLERSWGTKAFAAFWIFLSVISALSLSVGALVLGNPIFALPVLPLAGAGVVWGFLNAEEPMSFFFLPLRGIHFVAIAAVYVVFGYAPLGWGTVPFALVSCLAAYGWLRLGVSYRIQSWDDGLIPMSRPVARAPRTFGSRPNLKLVPEKPRDDRFTLSKLNPFRMWKRRQDRRKFEKLMGDD